uniref:Poly [ADP-ribose] polymerase 14 n=1 Tax=Magallana gigas TaxID=29159 RepID=A0A8W8ISW0_MAGGI
MVEKCRTIYVKGIDKSITYDLIETFFCNKLRSGGGDVEKVDYHPEDGYCIVYFENPSDAKNVAAKRKLTVIDKEIKAQMYFPCLGLPEQSINWKDMPYVSYKMNKYLIKFVKNHPAECRQIEEALQKKFVNVEWPESKSYLIVNLKCTVTKDVENAKEILKSWKEEAVAEMDSQMKKLVYQTRSILPEAWPLFLAQMKTVDIDDQDKVIVNSERKILTPVQQSPVQNADSDSEEEKPRRIRHKAYGLNYEIKVISGTLAKMRVDVIVNSTDKSLNLTLGATSKSLLRAGGESLQNECRMKYKYGVQPGKVAMTKGGNLHCRQVYHGAIQKWDHYKGDALSKFNEFVNNCLQMADKNLMSSIAFPAVGTGRLGYPRDLAARTMFKCCRDFLRQKSSTTLKKIIFVVYHEDKETFQVIHVFLQTIYNINTF